MIAVPETDLERWLTAWSGADIPVLRKTGAQLARLREREDSVSARELAAAVLQDPLLTARVLAYIEAHRRKRQNADITTIDRAIMMIGISPFFRAFENLPIVEQRLAPHPQALLGMLKVIGRARRAAHYARDWAALRHDLDVEEITVAALLHDLAEMLTWALEPAAALRLATLRRAQPRMRSHDAQLQVLGVGLVDLQQALCRRWHLPALLLDLMNDHHASSPRVRNVVLAVNLARHSADGWNDPALPSDLEAIAELLHLNVQALMMRLGIDPYLMPDDIDAAEAAPGNTEQR